MIIYRCTKADKLSPEDFRRWYNIFLADIPWEQCPTAGHAAYGDAVRVTRDYKHGIQTKDDPLFPPMTVRASNFMVYHTILKTSKDYYEALRWARKLTDELEEMINKDLPEEQKVKVFPYSVFYVFYEQYLQMWNDTLKSLGISLLAIFLVTFFLLGLDLVSAIISLVVILMILVNLGGMMYW